MAVLQTCYNFALVDKNEPTEIVPEVFIDSSSILIFLPTFSYILTPALTLGLPSMYTNINFYKTTKLALELFVKGEKHG